MVPMPAPRGWAMMREHAAPRGDLAAATITFTPGAFGVTICAGGEPDRLFTARFAGRQPVVSVADTTVSIDYRGRPGRNSPGVVLLNPDVAWAVRVEGEADDLEADLAKLAVTLIHIGGGARQVMVRLPLPCRRWVPVRIRGGARRVAVVRPAGVGATLHVRRGVADLTFDARHVDAVGGSLDLVSPPGEPQSGRYDLVVGLGASHLTLSTYGPDFARAPD